MLYFYVFLQILLYLLPEFFLISFMSLIVSLKLFMRIFRTFLISFSKFWILWFLFWSFGLTLSSCFLKCFVILILPFGHLVMLKWLFWKSIPPCLRPFCWLGLCWKFPLVFICFFSFSQAEGFCCIISLANSRVRTVQHLPLFLRGGTPFLSQISAVHQARTRCVWDWWFHMSGMGTWGCSRTQALTTADLWKSWSCKLPELLYGKVQAFRIQRFMLSGLYLDQDHGTSHQPTWPMVDHNLQSWGCGGAPGATVECTHHNFYVIVYLIFPISSLNFAVVLP